MTDENQEQENIERRTEKMGSQNSNAVHDGGRDQQIQKLRQENSSIEPENGATTSRSRSDTSSEEQKEIIQMATTTKTVPQRISSKDKLQGTINKIRGSPMKGELRDYTEPVMEITKMALRKEDGTLDEQDDKLMKNIDTAIKYAPKIAEFLTTIASGIRQNRPVAPAQTQQISRTPQPPPGWNEMGVLEKLKRKFTGTGEISAWYAAGIAYEQSLDITGTAPSYYPPQESAPQLTRKKEWKPTVEEAPVYSPPEPPVGMPNIERNDQHIKPEDLDKMHNQPQLTPEQEADAKLIAMALQQIDACENSLFLTTIDDPASAKDKITPFLAFAPASLKAILKAEKPENLLLAVEQHCPSKAPLLTNQDTKEKAIVFVKELQAVI